MNLEVMDYFDPDDERNYDRMCRYLWWMSAVDLTGGIRVSKDKPGTLQYQVWVQKTLGEIITGIVEKNTRLVHKVLRGKVEKESINADNYCVDR
jgi:hypothetical protein